MNVENPYTPSAAKPLEGDTIRKALRTKATCYLIGISFSMFIVCTFLHVCMCGHLAHATETSYPFHVALDAVLGLLLLSVPILAVGSHFRLGPLIVVPLSAIYLDHVLLASGGGFLFLLLDLPIMIAISVLAFRRFREANRTIMLDRLNNSLHQLSGSTVSGMDTSTPAAG